MPALLRAAASGRPLHMLEMEGWEAMPQVRKVGGEGSEGE